MSIFKKKNTEKFELPKGINSSRSAVQKMNFSVKYGKLFEGKKKEIRQEVSEELEAKSRERCISPT